MTPDERITELQASNTTKVNEIRMLRARLNASNILLQEVMLDRPLANILAFNTQEPYDAMRERNTGLTQLHARIELLENDAWTQTTGVARDFVKAACHMLEKPSSMVHVAEDLLEFVEQWNAKFKSVLG